MAKKKINKLHDVEVQTVGLVTVGANQEQFFLLKSQDAEEHTMSDQVVEVAPVDVDDEVVENFATRLYKSLVSKFAATPKDEVEAVEAETVVEEVSVEKAPEAEVVEEQQPEVEAETEVEKSADEEVVDEKVALEKANLDLAARLEAVEKQLKAKEEEAEKQVYVQKAQEFAHLGVDGAALADNLYFIAKADPARYQFWTEMLESFEARSKDSGLFDEIGKSGNDGENDKDFESALVDVIKAGDPKAISEKLASMTREEAEAYLFGRRAALRK